MHPQLSPTFCIVLSAQLQNIFSWDMYEYMLQKYSCMRNNILSSSLRLLKTERRFFTLVIRTNFWIYFNCVFAIMCYHVRKSFGMVPYKFNPCLIINFTFTSPWLLNVETFLGLFFIYYLFERYMLNSFILSDFHRKRGEQNPIKIHVSLYKTVETSGYLLIHHYIMKNIQMSKILTR